MFMRILTIIALALSLLGCSTQVKNRMEYQGLNMPDIKGFCELEEFAFSEGGSALSAQSLHSLIQELAKDRPVLRTLIGCSEMANLTDNRNMLIVVGWDDPDKINQTRDRQEVIDLLHRNAAQKIKAEPIVKNYKYSILKPDAFGAYYIGQSLTKKPDGSTGMIMESATSVKSKLIRIMVVGHAFDKSDIKLMYLQLKLATAIIVKANEE